MIVTEEQAKIKWCPQGNEKMKGILLHVGAMASGKQSLIDGVDKAIENDESNDNCIASDCMMWQKMKHGQGEKTVKGFCGLIK